MSNLLDNGVGREMPVVFVHVGMDDKYIIFAMMVSSLKIKLLVSLIRNG